MRRDDLEQGLMTGQSQSVMKNQASAFVYIVTKIFPFLATGVFASTTDVKKPESIALSAAMVSSTALPLFSDILKLTGRLPQLLEIIACLCMFAGVGMMDQGAIEENNQSARSIISLTAVGCFSLFAGINLAYNALKLAGCIQDRKPGVELASGSFGLVGSLLFLIGNTLGLLAQRDAGKSVDLSARMISVASLFTLSTALHTLLAGRAVCVARKPVDGALEKVLNQSADDDVRQLETEGRVTNGRESPNFPVAPSSSPVISTVEVPGSNSPRHRGSQINVFAHRSDFSSSTLSDGYSPHL